ncbi:hypothetical protein D3874_14535 [Oleomonas cavernae]|uniref:Uncharacterized protein n=1 Tax=Oleomonas cavernae TaxID=2320859 RepID=A0A418WDL6_9PROT|nr:hypothetical protein [Oleomonas cavernae]RJF88084.1 hypothetical protein D3874_14535 [Oleomonas cavernae]
MTAARLLAILFIVGVPLAGALGDEVIGPRDRLSAGSAVDGIDQAVRFRATTFRVTAEVAPRCGVSADVTTGQFAGLGVDCSSSVACLATVAVVPSAQVGNGAHAATRHTACRFTQVVALASAVRGEPMTVLVDF